MNKNKRERLRRAGWTIGSVTEFLGLTEAEAALVELKLTLSRRLKERRARSRLSQGQLAKLLGSSQSRVAKMESGDPSVSVDLLLRSVLAVGASPAEVARALGSRKKLIPA